MYNGASRRLVPPMSSCRFTRHEAEERQGNRLTWLTGRRERGATRIRLGLKANVCHPRGPTELLHQKKEIGAELIPPPRLSIPIATVPVAPRVVRIGTVTTVVIRPPPTAAIGPTNPTCLLNFRRRIVRDRRDRHRRSCGHCETATNCGSRKQERYFSHGAPPYTPS